MPHSKTSARAALALADGLALSVAAHADIHIGVIVSLTGPGASLGIPAANTIKLWPTELGGQKDNLFVLNDATDTTTAAKNATKLITEDKVDVIVGPSLTPTWLAVIEVAARSGVPVISLAGGGAIVEPQDGPRRWAFKMAPTETISINAVLDHMLRNKAGTVATIGITTAYGEGFLKAIERLAPAKGIKIVAIEKYAQADTSATPQVLKLIAANPDAVYIFSAGTPGALPHVELVKRGYKGLIYQAAWDAQLWLNAAIPVALQRGKPGTDEFWLALRDALEGLKEFIGTQGVFNLSDKDHNGVDARSQVMVKVEGGQWKLVK